MKFKMKRKYIIPEMNVESFSASSSILAGSPNQTGEGKYNVGGDGQGGTTGGGISGSDGGGLIQHSKQFDAWSSWDE